MKKQIAEREMFYGATPLIFERALKLRESMTKAEKFLWERLRQNQIRGMRFKSQHPISQFVVDFYCHKAKLVIELDGDIHNIPEINERDKNRTYELNQLGLKVIRFTNEEVFENINKVIKEININLK